jgi:3-methyladenine DNA glycosylase AlkD
MKPAKYIADHLRQVLINGASAPHTLEVQHFFKEEIQSRGWYTGEIRKSARRFTKVIKGDAGLAYLIEVADQLFRGSVLEEKVLAVFLLETSTAEMKRADFERFSKWLDRVSTWADHDGLASYLLGPMLVADPALSKQCLLWAKSKHRWHRRAAAVALIRGARIGMFESEITRVTNMLLHDDDDMVLKGLGWLLREAAKYNRDFAVALLTKIRNDAPRLVLRTGCETLPPSLREKLLAKTPPTKVRRRARAASAAATKF